MVSSLSNLVNNLSKGIHRIKCKQGHDDEKYKYCDCFVVLTESNYDQHFIIKELEEEFKNQFNSLGENTGKYITLGKEIVHNLRKQKTENRRYIALVPIVTEVTRIDKNKEEITNNMLHVIIY